MINCASQVNQMMQGRTYCISEAPRRNPLQRNYLTIQRVELPVNKLFEFFSIFSLQLL